MKLRSDKTVFNLYDTNGRRNDILNAYKIYLRAIDELKIGPFNEWKPYPNTLNQYKFYKRAINDSIDKFSTHPQFDCFEQYLKSNPDFNKKFHSLDQSLNFNRVAYTDKKSRKLTLGTILDNGIEARARHYTNSLKNMGLVNKDREITPVGKALLDSSIVSIDLLERTLNLSADNLVILRQILKVRVFNKKGDRYYSPGKFALYLILKEFNDNNIYSISNFMKLVQLASPAEKYTIDDIDSQLKKGGFKALLSFLILGKNDSEVLNYFKHIKDNRIPKTDFYKIFVNGKSTKTTEVYYSFYKGLCDFITKKNNDSYSKLKQVFNIKSNSNTLKKAFGYGKSIFKIREKASLKEFLNDNRNNDLLKYASIGELNKAFYVRFIESKTDDRVKENGQDTRYILEATGLFETKSGIMSIKNQDMFKTEEVIENLRNDIFNSGSFQDYEGSITSPFGEMISLTKILGISERSVKNQIEFCTKKYNLDDTISLEEHLGKLKAQEFEKFVNDSFPKDKVFRILNMFKDRDNDEKIRKEVTEEADIPTIFEYISGLAWYYLSDDNYCLINSFQLTFDANFLPLTHATGGGGDIIINYKDFVLMLEVTLMNKHAQKRGEWEPVLRHSINLAIDSDKPTATLFLADELDNNTINIWRAVASVPLESSNQLGKFTDTSVKIMPLKIDDFILFDESSSFSSRKLLEEIEKSYTPLAKKTFDTEWRDKIIERSWE